MQKTRLSDFNQLWTLLQKYMRRYWPQTLLMLACYLIASLLTAAQPMVTAPILDVAVKGADAFQALGDEVPTKLTEVSLNNVGAFLLHLFFPQQVAPWRVVVTIAIVYLCISVSLYILNFLVYLLSVWIRVKAGRDMQVSLFSHVVGLSLDFFNRRRTGELISRLDRDTDAVVFGLESIGRSVIVSSVLIFAYGALLIKTNWRLSLFVAAAGLLQYFFVQAVRKPVQNRVREQFNVQAEVTAYLQEVISNIRIVKSFVAEKFESLRLSKLSAKSAEAQFRFSFYKNIDEPATFIINSVVNVVILLFATREMLDGSLTTTGFFLYLFVGRSVLEPLTNLARAIKMIQTTVATSERVQALFAEKTSVQGGSIKALDFNKNIRFENVSFAYDDEKVLENINLEIEKGQVVALVGHSGAGKSTLTDLVMRFYDPQSGRILIDGIDLQQLELESYRRMIGVVSQDSILFNASVAENIIYPGEELNESRLEEAAQIANAKEFIERLPQGYKTLVGDRGVLLSGGQKQRITIARAVYRRPHILILDEATSSLDTKSERQVQEAIDKVIETTTAIVIAHRLSTVVNADKIIVIEGGRLLEQGRHEELLKKSAVYKRLCELQFDTSGRRETERPGG